MTVATDDIIFVVRRHRELVLEGAEGAIRTKNIEGGGGTQRAELSGGLAGPTDEPKTGTVLHFRNKKMKLLISLCTCWLSITFTFSRQNILPVSKGPFTSASA